MSSPKGARLIPQVPGPTPEEVVHISSFALIRKGQQILLAKRLRPEFTAGKWTIPSAIISYGEHPEDAVRRITKELLGSDPTGVRLLDFQSYGGKHWDLCFVYDVSIAGLGSLSPDVERAEYFDIVRMPPEFRGDHNEVLQGLMEKRVL